MASGCVTSDTRHQGNHGARNLPTNVEIVAKVGAHDSRSVGLRGVGSTQNSKGPGSVVLFPLVLVPVLRLLPLLLWLVLLLVLLQFGLLLLLLLLLLWFLLLHNIGPRPV